MKYKSHIIWGVSALCLFISMPLMAHCGHCGSDNQADSKEVKKASVYTCPMHPDIKSSQVGTCPVCGMELVPFKEGEKDHEGGDQHDHSKH